MILKSPGEVAFSVFNFPIYYYGIILAFAILLGVVIAHRLFLKFYDSEKAELIFEIAPAVILFGIVGARLYYCLLNFQYYVAHPLDVFNIREGGLSVHGMIIAGACCLWCFAKKYKIMSAKLFDVFLCATALAQSVGRWGNFFNSEAFGLPIEGDFLKLFIPVSRRPVEYMDIDYFHPAFLYESILDFGIFLILLCSFKKFSKYPGQITGLYLVLYGIVRIVIEQVRIDSVLNISGIPVAQLVSGFMILVGIIVIQMALTKRV